MEKTVLIFRENTGMTKIEVMISLAILTIVVGAAISFLTFSQRQFMWIDTDQKIQADMRAALQHMTINIRDAERFCAGSDTNYFKMRIPNLNDVGSALGYDTFIYKVDPSDTTRLLLELIQTATSKHDGWGKKISETYDAVNQETTSTWLMIDKTSNTYDSSPVALFSYPGGTSIFPYNEGNVFSVTVTLQVSRQSVPGKYQTRSLSTSVRSRNSF